MHDEMVSGLFNDKSIDALIYLIDHGRELEFEYKSKKYFISKNNSQKNVSIWNDTDEYAYDSMDGLIKNFMIGGICFEEIWNESELGILF